MRGPIHELAKKVMCITPNYHPQREIFMNIAGQKIKNSVVTEIGKFAILWNYFEHSHCNNHCNSSKIKEIANFINISEEKTNNLREALKNRMDIYEENITSYVHQGLHPTGSYPPKEQDELYMNLFINDNNEPIINTIGCLLVIQRIRNNMMHGLKDIHELESQLELFKAVNGVLEDI